MEKVNVFIFNNKKNEMFKINDEFVVFCEGKKVEPYRSFDDGDKKKFTMYEIDNEDRFIVFRDGKKVEPLDYLRILVNSKMRNFDQEFKFFMDNGKNSFFQNLFKKFINLFSVKKQLIN